MVPALSQEGCEFGEKILSIKDTCGFAGNSICLSVGGTERRRVQVVKLPPLFGKVISGAKKSN